MLQFCVRHNDLAHLEELLAQCPLEHRIVVTESLFSMDGDFADLRVRCTSSYPIPTTVLQGLMHLKHRYGFLFVVDEAHAVLVAGDNGGGISERDGVQAHVITRCRRSDRRWMMHFRWTSSLGH